MESKLREICQNFNRDHTRLMDIVRAVQAEFGHVPSEAIDIIATEVSTPRVEVESLVSFYSFFGETPAGKVVIRLCDDVIDKMAGAERVAEVFREELGLRDGQNTTEDGQFTFERTACIGLSDQAPAALIGEVPFTELTTDRVRELVAGLKKSPDPQKLVRRVGDGNNGHELVQSMVKNNVRRRGAVIFGKHAPESGLDAALALSPAEVIRQVKTARLRGRGGAGFPTGMKWEFARAADGARRFLICNADEGEPGTFKDRVLLTERADLLFEGMTIAGYAMGAETGILYLRGEYAYLSRYLEHLLESRRKQNLLGKDVRGHEGFNFDIRIQMGAGAYVCGEETALISSCEGTRGDPKNRPPFPAQRGYLGYPTTVNNVETLCSVPLVLEKGAAWYAGLGSTGSSGTKLLSISGDCRRPGVYEFEFGISLREVLQEAGADDVLAVQVGGPSGTMVGPKDFDRTICFDDLATGGSLMVFGQDRNVLEIVRDFLAFFVHESCGYCTPCRVGNRLLLERIDRVLAGQAEASDKAYLRELATTIKQTSRCGLGQTSPNPVLSTLERFEPVYDKYLISSQHGRQPAFDIRAAISAASKIAGRDSVLYPSNEASHR